MYSWLQRIFSTKDDKPRQPAVSTPPPSNAYPVADAVASGAVASGAAASGAAAPRPTAPQQNTLARAPKSANISWLQRSEIDAAFTTWMFDGASNAEIFTNPLENDILAALEKIVTGNQSGANLVRRMPGVIPQLLQSLRTENFSGAELAKKIAHDVVLVAAVIRVANSAAYNPTKPITSIEHSVLVLGQAGLRQLITSVAFQPIIDLNTGHYTKLVAPRLWEQSERCAVACRTLAPGHGVDPFEAFLAGLIQYVGLIVSLRVLDQMYDGKRSVGSETFCNQLIQYGRTLSCSIGREWHFPSAVIQAIEEVGDARNKNISPMGKVLTHADYLSKIHMLDRNGAMPGNVEGFRQDLSATEAACLDMLNALQEGEM